MNSYSLRLGFLAVIVFALFGCFDRGQGGLAPGEKAPSFDLPDLDGRRVTLDDFKGKTVILNFWGTWCAPCVAELPGLQALYEKGQGSVVVLGVSEASSRDEIRELKQRYGLTYPFVLDAQSVAQKKYKVNGLPETFILDKESRIALLPDPATGVATARIVGPREWDRSSVLESLLRIK